MAGKEQPHRDVGGLVEMPWSPPAGQPFGGAGYKTGRNQLVELLGHCRSGHAGGVDEVGDRQWQITHQQFHDSQASRADRCIGHGVTSLFFGRSSRQHSTRSVGKNFGAGGFAPGPSIAPERVAVQMQFQLLSQVASPLKMGSFVKMFRRDKTSRSPRPGVADAISRLGVTGFAVRIA